MVVKSPVEPWEYEHPKPETQAEPASESKPVEPVPVSGMAERVARCESGMRNVRNEQGSSASGYFQFIDSTWTAVTDLDPPAMAYDFETQLDAFYKLWDDGRGAHHWNPSRHCWS